MSSGNETEEIQRAFPPPSYRFAPRCPRRSSSHSSACTIIRPDSETRSCPQEIPKTSPVNSMPYSVRSWPQLDGHDSSAEHRERRARAAGDREPDLSIHIRHYCARCGRARSRRYQRDNPVDASKDPYPGICSRCIPPGGFTPAPRGPIVVDEEMEEVLIRRKRGNALTDLFQPRSVDEIRVRRRTDDRRALEDQPRQVSDGHRAVTRIRVRRSSEQLRGRIEKQEPISSNRVVRSTSRTREDPEPAEAEKTLLLRKDVHYRIASHPRAWSHGQMITALRPVRAPPLPSAQLAEPPEPRPPPGPPSPPEWYYRRVRRLVEPSRKFRNESSPEGFADRGPNFHSKPPRSPRMLPSSRLQEGHKHGKPPMRHHTTIRGAVEHARHDWQNRHNEPYEADRGTNRGSRLRGRSQSDDQRSRHVHFAPGTKGKSAYGRRQAEAANDFEQEQDDQKEYKIQKKKVHAGVHRGGGNYEIYDVDGHYSDDEDPRGKRQLHARRPAKPLYTKRDERAEGFLSWTDLLGGMDS